MSGNLVLLHGDDSFGIEQGLDAFSVAVGAIGRDEIVAERSPDEAAISAARLAAASVGMFGARLAVLRQPLRAAGRSTVATDRLLELVSQLPDGAALALAEERPSRDMARPPALLKRLADAVRAAGGEVLERASPRRNELQGWIRDHAARLGIGIQPRAVALLAERIGGAIWESDIERGEQTRVADSELRKLAIYAGERPVAAEDVELLTADTRPASVFGITNALDRREPGAAAHALARALAEGQPVLRIMASLEGRIADLITARDLAARHAPPAEITRRVGRGNARMADRLVESARRYSAEELRAMLNGLFEADLAIKTNLMEPAPAICAWLGQFLLGAARER